MASRQETFDQLKAQPNVSVLIVGGGINGVSTFRELAMQGVDVLLVEKTDFCSGASAASSHMMHGGIRYLENAEFRLVREALTERNRLLQNAPHFVFPQPTVIPIFSWLSGTFNAPMKFLGWSSKPAERGALIIRMGLIMYDIFASTQKSMPNHRMIGKEEMLRRFPGIDVDLIMGAQYYDGYLPYPERLTLELVLDTEAANDQARALNYTTVVGGEGDSVTLRDELTGEEHTVQPTIVINAAGPWIDLANQNMNLDTRFIGGTKGSHLVLDHAELRETLGENELFFENTDGRIVLILPLEDRVLTGTTDIRVESPDEAVCDDDEIDYILELVGRIFPKIDVSRDDVVFTFSGVRPLPNQDTSTTGQISRDHSIETVEAGNGTNYPVLSLVGGKWTTFRAFGEHTAHEVLNRLNMDYSVKTHNMPIGGGKDFPGSQQEQQKWITQVAGRTGVSEGQVRVWLRRYGTWAEKVARFASEGDDAKLTHLPTFTRREVEFVTRREKVFTLTDFVLRRSLVAMRGELSLPALDELAGVIGPLLGWNKQETAEHIEKTIARLARENRVELTDAGTQLNKQAVNPAEDAEGETANKEATPEPVAGD